MKNIKLSKLWDLLHSSYGVGAIAGESDRSRLTKASIVSFSSIAFHQEEIFFWH
ncbi:MAG: hypothetical protein HC786_31170 [Richelia sp. CSU_2_1]|nr:hypothetical protein [Microcoleus sp. SU_5_3]NJR26246.1 hypothetical protein [Richelia sp. CSU_2_1]